MDLLKNKLALVTGAGGGLGSAIARGFVREGARVIVADIHADNAAAVAKAITDAGGEAWSVVLDVTDRPATQDCAAHLTERFGPIDVLVNNAGISGKARIDEPEAAAVWDRLISVNLQGLFNVTHAFVPALKQSRGCIVNLSSIVAFVSGISSAGYVASKGAVRSLTQVLARDLAPFGVRANAVAPGLMLTDMVAPPTGGARRHRLVHEASADGPRRRSRRDRGSGRLPVLVHGQLRQWRGAAGGRRLSFSMRTGTT